MSCVTYIDVPYVCICHCCTRVVNTNSSSRARERTTIETQIPTGILRNRDLEDILAENVISGAPLGELKERAYSTIHGFNIERKEDTILKEQFEKGKGSICCLRAECSPRKIARGILRSSQAVEGTGYYP
jgi:hypothetical protein